MDDPERGFVFQIGIGVLAEQGVAERRDFRIGAGEVDDARDLEPVLDGADHVAPDAQFDHGVFGRAEEVRIGANGTQSLGQPGITQREGGVASKSRFVSVELDHEAVDSCPFSQMSIDRGEDGILHNRPQNALDCAREQTPL